MNPGKSKRICLWSSPRNVSTALMYSFAQRSDTQVFDEPLYPHFLITTKAERPDREVTLRLMENDGEKVVREVILGPSNSPILFFKNIANHIVHLDRAFLSEVQNVFLIRDPKEMILSYSAVIETPNMLDLAVEMQSEVFRSLQELDGRSILIDSKQLLLNPEKVLREMCTLLEVDWKEDMLSWSAGARSEDGPWAKYWYSGVHRSTGFKKYAPKSGELKGDLLELYERCLPHYEYLRGFSLQA